MDWLKTGVLCSALCVVGTYWQVYRVEFPKQQASVAAHLGPHGDEPQSSDGRRMVDAPSLWLLVIPPTVSCAMLLVAVLIAFRRKNSRSGAELNDGPLEFSTDKMAARYWKVAAEETREELEHSMEETKKLSELTTAEMKKLEDQLRIAESQRMSEIDKQAIGQSALLFEYAGLADLLAKLLEDVWHHWDSAGEKLVHPLLAANSDLRNWSSDSVILLSNELFEFRVLYRYHLNALSANFPGFVSETVKEGFPSDSEYTSVRRNLSSHASLLRSRAEVLWQCPRDTASEGH